MLFRSHGNTLQGNRTGIKCLLIEIIYFPKNVLFVKKNRTQYTRLAGKNNKKYDILFSFYGLLPLKQIGSKNRL